jgi:predicted RNA-binding protein YlxR (DUF448 family)
MFHQDMEVREIQHEKPAQGGDRHPTMSRVRTCVGCGERVELHRSDAAAMTLIRLVLGPAGAIAVDVGSSGFGRGVHVHPQLACVERAALRGIARAAKAKVTLVWHDEPTGSLLSSAESVAESVAESGSLSGTHTGLVPLEPASLSVAIVRAVERRARGLLLTAVRTKCVALGVEAVTRASERGTARLVVVATDAAADSELSVVRDAVVDGRAVAWGTKQVLAALCLAPGSSERTEGLGVVAIGDDRIATAFRAAVHAAAALSSMSSRTTKRSSGVQVRRQKTCSADVGDGVVEAANGSELSILERGA